MDIAAIIDAAEAPAPAEAAAETVEGAEASTEAANDNAEGTEGGEEQAEAAQTAEAAPTDGKKTPPAAAEEDIFSDAALATPEGIGKARTRLQEDQQKHFRKARELDGRDIRLKNKEQKLAHDKQEWVRNKGQDVAFIQDVRNTVNLIKTGTAAQRVEALGRLTGLPGQKAYEELSFGIIHDGKKQPLSPEMAAMQQQIEGLHGVIEKLIAQQQGERTATEQQQQRAFIAEQQTKLITAGKDAAKYPNLAHFIGSGREREVSAYLTEMKIEHHEQTGTLLDDGEALGRIERELTQALGARAAKPTSSGPPSKPGGHQAQRTPGHKAIPPSLAARSGGAVRELTHDERLDELSRDSEFLALLGR
jgi:hypothetical protein